MEGKQQAEQSGEQQDSVRFKKKQTEDEEGGIEETGDEDDDGPKPHPPDPEIDKQDWKPFFAKNVKDLMKFGKDILEADSEQRENMWSLYAEDAVCIQIPLRSDLSNL